MPLHPESIPLSLYVHFPWCVRKCPYCDFNSHASPASLPVANYFSSLKANLFNLQRFVQSRPLISVFFGGGTPSLIAPHYIEEFLDHLAHRYHLASDAEITVEANPGAADSDYFGGYHAAGANRISIGAQSFTDRHLRSLGRIHSAEDIAVAIQRAQDAGFENFNLDLMYALPDQDPLNLRDDLERALSFRPRHISIYQLTLEPGTHFGKFPPELPAEDRVSDMEQIIAGAVESAGYDHYEVSAYSLAGYRCSHNLNYWTFGDYLGVGAGAHSKISLPGGITRMENTRQPNLYMKQVLSGKSYVKTHAVENSALPLEFMLNALRLSSGFSRAIFEQRTGLTFDAVKPPIRTLCSSGLAAFTGDQVQLTHFGGQFLDNVLEAFVDCQ